LGFCTNKIIPGIVVQLIDPCGGRSSVLKKSGLQGKYKEKKIISSHFLPNAWENQKRFRKKCKNRTGKKRNFAKFYFISLFVS
jgi:hypothetical protein